MPGTATATLDGRFLPGSEATFRALLRGVAGDRLRFREIFSGPALQVPTTGPLMSVICAAVQAEDPGAHVLPYLSTPFTDAKWLSRLGIDCYGFVPMLLPADLDFTALFHGVDERVPTASLEFCVRTLEQLLLAY